MRLLRDKVEMTARQAEDDWDADTSKCQQEREVRVYWGTSKDPERREKRPGDGCGC